MSPGDPGCSFLFISCSVWGDVGAAAATVITVGGQVSYTYGGYFDPSGANAYTYETLNGALFTTVEGFPSCFSSPVDITSGGIDYGLFSPGQSLTFPGAGVSSFTISGINPTVDGSNPIAYPIEIALNQDDAQVEAIAFNQTTSSTPEPAPIGLCAAGVILLGIKLRRRRHRTEL
jgi:hypothetical protein